MSNTYYKKGQWSAICDRCGFEFKSSKLLKTWDGLMVDKACFEVRHPQDFIRGVKDQQAVPWSRPEAVDKDLNGNTATADTPIPYMPIPS